MFSPRVITVLAALSTLFGSSVALIIDDVSITDRSYWCSSQTTQCPLLCAQFPGGSTGTQSNTCDAETLVYSCVCDNGQSPNASEYSLTVPYYICTETNNQCVTACGNHNNECSNDCRTKHPCGAQSPVLSNSTSTASSTASKTSSTGSSTASSGDFGGPSSDNTGAAPVVAFGGQLAALTLGSVAFVGFSLLY